METTFSRVNIDACIASRQKPGAIIDRGIKEQWYILEKAVLMAETPAWVLAAQGDNFFIPALPYLMQAEPELMLAYAIQLGVKIASGLRGEVQRLHLVIGSPLKDVLVRDAAHPDGVERWQQFIGCAILLRGA